MTPPDETPAQAPTPAPPPAKRYYVSFSADIDAVTTEGLLDVCVKIAGSDFTELYLMLSTPGGSVMNGMNIYFGPCLSR